MTTRCRLPALLVLCCCGVAACGGSSVVGPVEVLDQDPMLVGPGPSGISGQLDKAQTFTVGVSGALTRIELMLYEGVLPQPLLIDIRPTVAGAPVENDAAALASWMVGTGELPTTTGIYTSFDVTPFNLDVTAGDVYAICLRSPGSGTSAWLWHAQVVPYAGGQTFIRDQSQMAPAWGASNGIHAFRTYVLPPP